MNDIAAAAAEIIGLLSREEYAKVHERFDTRLKGAAPEFVMRETWRTALARLGPLQRYGNAEVVEAGGRRTVFVRCEFDRATYPVHFVFSPEGKVSGMGFGFEEETTG